VHEQIPDTGMGVIQQQILEAIYDVKMHNNQMFFDIWCKGRLPKWAIHLMLASVDKAREAGMIG
jgi:hypothetical protein